MTTYIDAGWTGTPTALTAALESFGFQINENAAVSVINPTLNTVGIVAVTGYRVLDGIAYLLIRSTNTVPLPDNVSAVSPDHTAVISGVFMSDVTVQTTISSLAFFSRFTQAETAAIWAAAVANPAIGVGLMNGLASGFIDLTSPALELWVDALVAEKSITSDRKSTVLTP
jgi:hypothetical protein